MFILFSLAGCTNQPVISPDRWIDDYDYEQNFNEYLVVKYEEAIALKRVPYIYIYADWCPPCVRLRNKAKTSPEFADVFVETQMIMLDYDRLIRVAGTPNYGGVPVITAIESNGNLATIGMNGIPWYRLPKDIVFDLCAFFELRRIASSSLDRNCYR